MNRQANDPPDAELKTDKGDLDAEQVVVAYHERTKHYYHRYAASLGYLDWAQQPDPFRRYNGAPLLRLALPDAGRALPYWQLYVPENVAPAPLSVDAISLFFRYALSLTAWKGIEGTTWPLRANPSSGNLHPTEGYVLLPSLDAMNNRPGVYHYASKEHGLELRADLDPSVWVSLRAGFPEGFLFLFSLGGVKPVVDFLAGRRGSMASEHSGTCQHDVGPHALWVDAIRGGRPGVETPPRSTRVGSAAISQLLGLDREADYDDAEREHPELVALVVRDRWVGDGGLCLSNELISQVSSSRWYGTANVLSPKHGVNWPVIDEVARATTNSGNEADEVFSGFPSEGELFTEPLRSGAFTAEQVILGRRSAVRMDGATAISAATFFRMMARLMPTQNGQSMPWDALPWRPRIHLGLFVHRVNGLSPGLYVLARDPKKVETLKQVMRPEFQWLRPPSCPHGLPLFLLKEGDCRNLAASVSCGQEIAGDGAFGLGMIAEFMCSLVTNGAGFSLILFWVAGLVGQVLYLEAEDARVFVRLGIGMPLTLR